MSKIDRTICDNCKKEKDNIVDLREARVSYEWHTVSGENRADLDFCSMKCIRDFFGRMKDD